MVYQSKRHSSVALSSAEAGYVALAFSTQEDFGFSTFSKSLTSHYLVQQILWGIKISNQHGDELVLHARAKPIDLRAHFARDHVESENIGLEYVTSKDQSAEILIKAFFDTALYISTRAQQRWSDLRLRGSVTSSRCVTHWPTSIGNMLVGTMRV